MASAVWLAEGSAKLSMPSQTASKASLDYQPCAGPLGITIICDQGNLGIPKLATTFRNPILLLIHLGSVFGL